MNTLDIVMLVLTAVPVLLGLILGATRGLKRSIGRILVVVGCIVAAYYLKDMLSGKILEFNFGGKTVQDTIVEWLGSVGLSDIGDTAVIIAKLIVTIALFVLLFLVIQFLSLLIVTPIINLILGKVQKKKAGGGALVGLIQGVVVALVLCVPVNGTIQNVAKIANLDLVNDSTSSSASVVVGKNVAYAEETSEGEGDTSSETDTTDGTDSSDASTDGSSDKLQSVITLFQSYSKSSTIGNIYNTIGQKAFDEIAKTTYGDDAKTYTFSGQISAIEGAANVASALQKFQKLENSTATAEETIASVKEAFAALDELPSESKETIQNVLSATIKMAGLADSVDTSKIKDFNEINFTQEGEIIEDVYEFSQKDETTRDDVNTIVKTVADSDLILPLLDATDTKIEDLTIIEKADAKIYIDSLADVKDDKKAILYKIFGLEASSESSSTEESSTESKDGTAEGDSTTAPTTQGEDSSASVGE